MISESKVKLNDQLKINILFLLKSLLNETKKLYQKISKEGEKR